MITVKRVVLDVLKPHQPNALEFSKGIAQAAGDCCVHLTVLAVDANTETLKMLVEGESLDFEAIENSIRVLGGSLHSIDEVEVQGDQHAE